MLKLMGFIDSSLKNDVVRMSGGNAGAVRSEISPGIASLIRAAVADVEFSAGAERQRNHALTTLRLKPAKYVGDCGSDRRFMTFSRITGLKAGPTSGLQTCKKA
jgi:hypothetical protein